jgi:hypothetical protein
VAPYVSIISIGNQDRKRLPSLYVFFPPKRGEREPTRKGRVARGLFSVSFALLHSRSRLLVDVNAHMKMGSLA